MRKKQKHFSRLLFGLLGLFLIGITFGSCEAEKDFAEESANGKINYVKIADVPFLIPTIQNFNHDYDYLTNPNLSDARRDDLNLNLDLNHIIEYVKENGIKTYSIRVINVFEEYDDKYLENLHIYKEGTDYVSFLTTYNEIDDTKVFDMKTLNGEVKIFDINNNYLCLAQIESGRVFCVKEISNGPWHIWINNDGSIEISVDGQGTGGFNEPVEEQPEFLANDGYQSGAGAALEEPCVQLNQKTEQSIFKSKLTNLNNLEHFSLDHETGYFENKNNLGGVMYSYVTAPTGTHNLKFSQSCYGFIHVHQNDYYVGEVLKRTVKMFSPQDIYAFIFNCQDRGEELGLSASDTYGIMISSEGVYAMKMLAPIITPNRTAEYWNNFVKEYKKKTEELISADKLNSTEVQKMFLNFLKDKGLYNNIGLFKANTELTQWNRVELDGDNLKESQCN